MLATLLQRAINNEQLVIGINSDFMTHQIVGVCDHGEMLEIQLQPAGLKWLWVRHAGSLGGKQKAARRKKRTK